jgi:DNA-binding NtrC family response regulator
MAWRLLLVELYRSRGKIVKKDITILIADRNPHVRKFLQREMTAAGYRVQLADTAREVIKRAFHHEPLDLVILDPDLPDADESHMLHHLLSRVPALPVVVHTYASEYGDSFKDMEALFFVEKKGSSVERLKQVVYDILV